MSSPYVTSAYYSHQRSLINHLPTPFDRSIAFSRWKIRNIEHCCAPLFHNGCVNTCYWTTDGRHLVTGSDDLCVKVWNTENILVSEEAPMVYNVKTSHRSNIFCAKTSDWNPNLVVSCAGDGRLLLNDLTSRNTAETERTLSNGNSLLHMFIFDIDQPSVLYAAENDGIVVRVDLRDRSKSIVFANHESTGTGGLFELDANSMKAVAQSKFVGCNYLFVGGDGHKVGQFDLRATNAKECSVDETPSISELLANRVATVANYVNIYSPEIERNDRESNLSDIDYDSCFNDIYPAIAYKQKRDGYSTKVDFRNVQVSCICFNEIGNKMLVNYQSDNVHQFLLTDNRRRTMSTLSTTSHSGTPAHNEYIPSCNVFSSHQNHDTFLKTCAYFGPNDEYVVTGCDSGNIIIFNSNSGSITDISTRAQCEQWKGIIPSEVVVVKRADSRICNGVVPHPFEPILVSYGIDSDAKIWGIACEDSTVDEELDGMMSKAQEKSINIESTIINEYLNNSKGRSNYTNSFLARIVPEISLKTLYQSKCSRAKKCKYKACSLCESGHCVDSYFFQMESKQYWFSIGASESSINKIMDNTIADNLFRSQSIQHNQWLQYYNYHHFNPRSISSSISSSVVEDPSLSLYSTLPYYPMAYVTHLSKFRTDYIKIALEGYCNKMFFGGNSSENTVNFATVSKICDLEAFLMGIEFHSLFKSDPYSLISFEQGNQQQLNSTYNLIATDMENFMSLINIATKMKHLKHQEKSEFFRESFSMKNDCVDDKRGGNSERATINSSDERLSLKFMFNLDEIKALNSYYNKKLKSKVKHKYINNVLNDKHILIVTQLTAASLMIRKAGNQFLKLKQIENAMRCYQQSINYCSMALIVNRDEDECSPVVWNNIKEFYSIDKNSTLKFVGFQNYHIDYEECDCICQIKSPVKGDHHMVPSDTTFALRNESIHIGDTLLVFSDEKKSSSVAGETITVDVVQQDISMNQTEWESNVVSLLSQPVLSYVIDDKKIENKEVKENSDFAADGKKLSSPIRINSTQPNVGNTSNAHILDKDDKEKPRKRMKSDDLSDYGKGLSDEGGSKLEPSEASDCSKSIENILALDSSTLLSTCSVAANLKWMRYLEGINIYNSYSLPVIMGNQAALALQLGDFKLTVAICEKAIEVSRSLKQKQDAKIYYRLGMGYYNTKDYDASIKTLSQALEIATMDTSESSPSGSEAPPATTASAGDGLKPKPPAPASTQGVTNPQVGAILKALSNAKVMAEAERKQMSKKYQKMFGN